MELILVEQPEFKPPAPTITGVFTLAEWHILYKAATQLAYKHAGFVLGTGTKSNIDAVLLPLCERLQTVCDVYKLDAYAKE
ncbi:hypothetical protein LCGC14_1720780 [marine sediment metagenome]|uniref:Uncharacterized protein n=1 Tax=marine sediment metagenome TaxID=412755 RepID=A0A0F9HCK6_9ZZZZ